MTHPAPSAEEIIANLKNIRDKLQQGEFGRRDIWVEQILQAIAALQAHSGAGGDVLRSALQQAFNLCYGALLCIAGTDSNWAEYAKNVTDEAAACALAATPSVGDEVRNALQEILSACERYSPNEAILPRPMERARRALAATSYQLTTADTGVGADAPPPVQDPDCEYPNCDCPGRENSPKCQRPTKQDA